MSIKITLSLILIGALAIAVNAQEGSKYELLYNKSVSSENREDIKDSIQSISKQIHSDPDNAVLYLKRGTCYSLLGLNVDAIDDYNRAIRHDSLLPQAYYNRAISRARFAFTKGSCVDLKKASSLGMLEATELYNQKCGKYFKELE